MTAGVEPPFLWGGSVLFSRGFPQFRPPNLPRHSLRKFVDELDFAGVLVRGEFGFDVRFDLLGERVRRRRIRTRDDKRLDDVPAFAMGLGDDRGLCDRRVLAKRTLDFERADAVARRENHVVGAAFEPEVAVFVHVREVARQIPLPVRAVDEAGTRLLGLVPVLREETGVVTAFGDFARLTRRQNLAGLGVDDGCLDAGEGLAHRPRSHGHRRVVVDNHVPRLGLAVGVENGHAEGVFGPFDDARTEGFADGEGVTEVGVGVREHVFVFAEHAVGRRDGEKDRDRIGVEQVRPHFGVELAFVGEECRPPEPRTEGVDCPRQPAEVTGAPVHVAGLEVDGVTLGCRDARNPAVFVQDALCEPGRPGGVVQKRVVLAAGPCGFVVRAGVVERRVEDHIVGRCAVTAVDCDDVFDARRVGECVGDGLAVVRRRDDDRGVTVVESVGDAVGTEPLVDAAPHCAVFERPHEGDVVFRNARHVRDHAVARLDAEVVEDVRELARTVCEFPKGQRREFAVRVDLIESDSVAVCRMSVDGFVSDIEFLRGVPRGFSVDVVPREVGSRRVVVAEIVCHHFDLRDDIWVNNCEGWEQGTCGWLAPQIISILYYLKPFDLCSK